MIKSNRILSVGIKGFRSLADFHIEDLPKAAVLIGANGSGKSNFIRFFEMMSWMVRSRNLQEFIQRHGGADDQLFGGTSISRHLDATVTIRTESGTNDYGFALSHAHPDRFLFTKEEFRYNSDSFETKALWQPLGSGHTEATIVEKAQSQGNDGVNPEIARVIVRLLRSCSVFQFHDTSDASSFKVRWDAEDNNYLRSNGGNLAAILLRLEREDLRRYETICRHISRVLPTFDRFDIEESFGRVFLRWKANWTNKRSALISLQTDHSGSLR